MWKATTTRTLIDIVSKNGNLLLNVGPKPDGTMPAQIVTTLREMGVWLRANGEAIYGTRPWVVFGEGPTQVVGGAFHDTDTKAYTAQDFRFTTKGDALYAIGMGCPADGKAVIHSLGWAHEAKGMAIGNVELVGQTGKVEWKQTAEALEATLPAGASCQDAYVLKVTK